MKTLPLCFPPYTHRLLAFTSKPWSRFLVRAYVPIMSPRVSWFRVALRFVRLLARRFETDAEQADRE